VEEDNGDAKEPGQKEEVESDGNYDDYVVGKWLETLAEMDPGADDLYFDLTSRNDEAPDEEERSRVVMTLFRFCFHAYSRITIPAKKCFADFSVHGTLAQMPQCYDITLFRFRSHCSIITLLVAKSLRETNNYSLDNTTKQH
jgi:hypothetical protein